MLELIFPMVGVAYVSTVMLFETEQADPEVMVTSRVPWAVPVHSIVTVGLVEDPMIVPLVTVHRKV